MTKWKKKRWNFDSTNFFQKFFLDSGGFWRNFDVSNYQNFGKISENSSFPVEISSKSAKNSRFFRRNHDFISSDYRAWLPSPFFVVILLYITRLSCGYRVLFSTLSTSVGKGCKKIQPKPSSCPTFLVSRATIGFYFQPNLHYLRSIYQYLKAFIFLSKGIRWIN